MAVARIQWKLALHPPPELAGNEKIVLWLLLLPLLTFVALALGFFGYMAGSHLGPEPVFFHNLLVGLGAFLMFLTGISMPFAERSLSGFEISRLFHLPIRPGEVLASQVLGNVLNPGIVIIPGAFMIGCVAGTLRAALYLTSLRCCMAGLIWLVQFALMIMVSDYVLLSLRRVKQLRRLALLLVIFVGAGLIWLLQILKNGTGVVGAPDRTATIKHAISALWETCEPVAGYLPGISPLAWVTLRPGWWAVLLVAVAETAVLFVAGARLLDGIMGGRVIEETPEGRKGRRAFKARRTGLLERLPIWPFLVKDLRLLLREKNIWLTMFGVGICLAAVPQMFLGLASEHPDQSARFLGDPREWVGPICTWAVVLLLGSFSLNQLGQEGQAIQLVLAAPVPRWRFLAGKNLALLLMSALIMTFAEAGLLFHRVRWATILADCVFFLTLQAWYLSVGNLASVLWPYPASISGKATGLKVSQVRLLLVSLNQLVLMLLFGYVALPPIFGRVAMASFGPDGWLYWFVAVCMILYGSFFYALMLAGAGRLLEKREQNVFERIMKQ
jgi:hypothetical protein